MKKEPIQQLLTGMLYKPHPPAGAGKDIVPKPAPAVNGQNSAKIAPFSRVCVYASVYLAKPTEPARRGAEATPSNRKEQIEQMSDRLEDISIAVFRARQLITLLHAEFDDEPAPDLLDAITSAVSLLLDQASSSLEEAISESLKREQLAT